MTQQPRPVLDHAQLAEREAHEHTQNVELDEFGDIRLVRNNQRRRNGGKHDDSV